jgi:cytochrome c-type biogenesis protein CcmH/NrfG
MSRNGRINWVFGGVVGALALLAAVSMLRNEGRPPILAPEESNPASSAALPENHPPIDALSRADTLLQMIQKDPQNAELRIQLGNAYYDAGLYREAASAYEEGIAIRPQDPEVETDLATCYHYQGQDDKALQTLDRVLRERPGFAQALFNKGVILQTARNDAAGAVAAWQELLRSNPDYPRRNELEQKIAQLQSAIK